MAPACFFALHLGAWVSNTPAGPSRGPGCAVERSDRDLPALAGSGS